MEVKTSMCAYCKRQIELTQPEMGRTSKQNTRRKTMKVHFELTFIRKKRYFKPHRGWAEVEHKQKNILIS
jgi:hypothetical protein